MQREKTIQEMSIGAKLLVERLAITKVDEIIKYAEMNEITGGNVQREHHGMLETARRAVTREYRIVFGTIRNVGIKRLADNEIVGTGTDTVHRIRRMSKRGARKLACVQEFDNMSTEEQIRHNSMVSMLGTLFLFSSPTSVKKIESSVKDNAAKELSEKKVLELFAK